MTASARRPRWGCAITAGIVAGLLVIPLAFIMPVWLAIPLSALFTVVWALAVYGLVTDPGPAS